MIILISRNWRQMQRYMNDQRRNWLNRRSIKQLFEDGLGSAGEIRLAYRFSDPQGLSFLDTEGGNHKNLANRAMPAAKPLARTHGTGQMRGKHQNWPHQNIRRAFNRQIALGNFKQWINIQKRQGGQRHSHKMQYKVDRQTQNSQERFTIQRVI